MTIERVVDLLNENEQLRKESYGNLDGLNYYQEQNGHLSERISDLECENEQLKKENEKLQKENHGIQDKIIRLLDYVEVKQCVTRTEIKKWWNGDDYD